MTSIWSETCILKARPALKGRRECEVAVIGGGMAGVLIAWMLRQRGIDVLILEANRLGSGQTRNTTAKVTAQHGNIYERLIREQGETGARQYAAANQQAVEEFRRLIRDQKIDCDWLDCPAYLYSTAEEELLQQEARAAAQAGLQVEFTTRVGLPFPVKGAVRMNGQGQFHPLKFLGTLAEELEVFEHSRVTEVEGSEIYTEYGRVKAGAVVFATHYPFLNTPGYYFARMHQERSYVTVLKGACRLDGIYYGVDPGGLSLRHWGDLVLVGGENHRTGENRSGGRYTALEQAARELYPAAEVVCRWSAQDCMTLDGIPYIGRYAPSTPEWYVATGFGKWGMTSSMVSALRISELITGASSLDTEVFSPRRLDLAASAANLWEEGKQSVKGLCRSLFAGGRAEIEDLPNGHGGVVELEGEKVGAYKTEDGEVIVVSTRCPHLGCQLEWNPDEKSWDCPCHGSRFDGQGRLICGPAQRDLDFIS